MHTRQRSLVPGRTLRLARHLTGESQRGFADRLRMRSKTVGKAEVGWRPVEAWLFEAAAHAAGMKPATLIILRDAAEGSLQLDPEQRAWLAEQLLQAALLGLRGESPS